MQRYFEINGSGHNIRCKLYYQNLHDIRRAVIFAHGFGGHKDNSAAEKFAQRLLSKYKGTAMVTFNWPCHGDDVKKKLCLEDCMAYLNLVTSYVREKFGAWELYAYGTSFGGYLILKYITEFPNPFRKIALRCPAINMYEAITSTIISPGDLEKIRKDKEVPVGFDRKVLIGPAFLEELKDCDIRSRDYLDHAENMLILHGTADEIVPFSASSSFADENLIEFIPVEGADHRFQHPQKMEQAIKAILDFYQL